MTPAKGKPGRASAVTKVEAELGPRTALGDLPGVGPQRAKTLARLGLDTIENALVQHLPLRHEDRSRIIPLGRVSVGEARTCAGTIAGISPPPRGRPRMPLGVMIRDASGVLYCARVDQPHLTRGFSTGRSAGAGAGRGRPRWCRARVGRGSGRAGGGPGGALRAPSAGPAPLLL